MTANIRFSKHARQRLDDRGVTEAEVLASIEKVLPRIIGRKESEIRVLIRKLPRTVRTPDGSTGNLVVACIDTASLTVKTVMLRQSNQAPAPRGIAHIGF